MAELIGNELPEDLYRRLSGDDLESCVGKAILISTVDPNGWPHPAMLSYFEVIAKDRSNIRLAPYKDSHSTENMRRNGRLTISIIDAGVAYYIKGIVQELKREMDGFVHLSQLNFRVEQVLNDQANAAYEAEAYVSGGVTYKNLRLAAELSRAEAVLKELLE